MLILVGVGIFAYLLGYFVGKNARYDGKSLNIYLTAEKNGEMRTQATYVIPDGQERKTPVFDYQELDPFHQKKSIFDR